MDIESRELSSREGNFTHDTLLDDDDKPKRTGTYVTASAHIITAVIGSGVLSLSWCLAQLGWIAGIIMLLMFSCITFYTATLLADCYRFPDPITGRRIYTYIDVVKTNLGQFSSRICAIFQAINLVGLSIGYVITSAISMAALKKSHCFHKNGHNAGCQVSTNNYMIIFGVIEIILSQAPNFNELTGISIVAAIMSFSYSLIGIGLSIAKIVGGSDSPTSITGTVVGVDVTSSQKVWNALQSLGDIAIAYCYAQILIEIQDTLKSSPPENKTMKRANVIGIVVITIFYMMCGILGYAAFGNKAPGNFLTGFGFYEPFWLIDIGNICIIVHLVGAYQVFSQPVFSVVENCFHKWWPNNVLMKKEYAARIPLLGVQKLNILRLLWRTTYVIITTVIGMIFPFFNAILGLLGALTFFPLTVYFPVKIFLARAKVPAFSTSWIFHQLLILFCFIIAVVACIGSIEGIIKQITHFKPFQFVT